MIQFTRRQLAGYAAEQLLAGNSAVINELASYLFETKRTKEVPLLVRDIESALQDSGVLVADVAGAHGLDDKSRSEVSALLQQKYGTAHIQLREHVDPSLLGGLTIRTADEAFDGSLRRSINQLKAMKV